MKATIVFVGTYQQAAQWILTQPNVTRDVSVVPTSGGRGSVRALQGRRVAPTIVNPHGFLVKQGSADELVLREARKLQSMYR